MPATTVPSYPRMSPRLILISLAMLRLFSGWCWNHSARTVMIQVRLTTSATKSATVTMKTLEMALFTRYPLSARRRRSSSLPPRMMLERLDTISRSATSTRFAVIELPP